MTYLGHHSDGSSIQRHSAGPHYPFVLGMQDRPEGKWFVMAPSGDIVHRTHSYDEACDHAIALARSYGK